MFRLVGLDWIGEQHNMRKINVGSRLAHIYILLDNKLHPVRRSCPARPMMDSRQKMLCTLNVLLPTMWSGMFFFFVLVVVFFDPTPNYGELLWAQNVRDAYRLGVWFCYFQTVCNYDE